MQMFSRYKDDPEFAHSCCMITSIAFVPPAYIEIALAELDLALPDELEPIIGW